jgi:hypothetical protein
MLTGPADVLVAPQLTMPLYVLLQPLIWNPVEKNNIMSIKKHIRLIKISGKTNLMNIFLKYLKEYISYKFCRLFLLKEFALLKPNIIKNIGTG